jgi:hypothetical protein
MIISINHLKCIYHMKRYHIFYHMLLLLLLEILHFGYINNMSLFNASSGLNLVNVILGTAFKQFIVVVFFNDLRG